MTTCWGAPRRTYDIRWNSLGAGNRTDVVMLTDTPRAGAREPLVGGLMVGGLSRFVPGFLLPARQAEVAGPPRPEEGRMS